MDIASKIPVVEGGPAKRGNRTNWFPGGRGARGDILSQATERDIPESGLR
jgi:hypothetical protein